MDCMCLFGMFVEEIEKNVGFVSQLNRNDVI